MKRLCWGCAALLTAGVGLSGATPVLKSPAAGILYLCDDAAGPLQGQTAHFDNAACDGVMFRTAWGEMEPLEGEYQWAKVDAMLGAANQSGKSLGLGIAAGFRSPRWLEASGVAFQTGTLLRSFAPARTVKMPWIWDEAYLKKWGNFLQAAGGRYDGNPRLAYITIAGMGHAFEPYMAKSPEDIEHFRKSGGLPRWEKAAKNVIDLYARAFPQTPFLLAAARPIPTADADASLAEVVRYGLEKYPGRFGVMSHGLNAGTSEFNPIDRIIRDNSLKVPVGYQMVWSTTGVNAGWLKGSLEEVLGRAVAMKAHFVEVYGRDCDDEQYRDLLARAGLELKDNSRGFTSRFKGK